MSVDAVAVPQHLDLEDVVAWGLGPTDLLCVVGGVALGWWLDLRIGDPLVLQLAVAAPPALVGIACGIVRIGERSLRAWIGLVLGYLVRPRVLRT